MTGIQLFRTLEIDGKIEDVMIEVNVKNYVHVPPWKGDKYSCPSDEDFYGYTTLEYEIVGTYKFLDEGIGAIPIDLKIDQELEGSIYDELLTMAASYREQDIDDEPLCYVRY